MKEIIQLNLTQDEALLLGAITALGITRLEDNQEEIKTAKAMLTLVLKLSPEATVSLAEKMVLLCNVTKKYAKEELLKVK